MLHGLIPIVIKDTGFNRLNENAIFLEDFKISYLDERLTKISMISSEELAIYSKRVFDFAHENFSRAVFERSFKKIMDAIVKNEQND